MSDSYADKYGPWAVITGASDGTGAAYARELAARGLNLVLIARRLPPLEALAAELAAAHEVEIRVASIDLYDADASPQVIAAAEGVEVGMYISNAGADPYGSSFLDAPVSAWRNLVNRNVVAVMETTYAFAQPMVSRGRGGIILMSSGTALGGQPGVAVYCATKGFDLNLGEALWGELGARGVDVLAVVSPAMDTPSLQALIAPRGLSVPGLFDPAYVARTAIERLPDGPTLIFPFGPEADQAQSIEEARRARTIVMIEATKMFTGDEEG
jgi:uncharacterized protein